MKPDTPMIDKAMKLELQNLQLVRFLRWLAEKGCHVCAWDQIGGEFLRVTDGTGASFEKLVADYQGIDLAVVAKERATIVDWANRAVTGRCQRLGCDGQPEPGFTLCPACIEEAIQRG